MVDSGSALGANGTGWWTVGLHWELTGLDGEQAGGPVGFPNSRLNVMWPQRRRCGSVEGEEEESQSERRKRRKRMQHDREKYSSLLSAYTLLSTHPISHSLTTRCNQPHNVTMPEFKRFQTAQHTTQTHRSRPNQMFDGIKQISCFG